MKKQSYKTSLAIYLLIVSTITFAQPNGHWRLNGNNNSPPDDITLPGNNRLGSQAGFNVPILFQTNGFSRLLIDGGASNITGGRIAIGNNLPAGFSPQARLHIHHGFSLGNNEPFIRFTTVTTNTTNTDGFTIGNSSNFNTNNNGIVNMNQFEQEPIIVSLPNANPTSPNLLPYEWFRIENGRNFQAIPNVTPMKPTDGYVGLNNPSPRAHIDMVTPTFQGGEEFFFAKPADLTGPNVQMGMMNSAARNS